MRSTTEIIKESEEIGNKINVTGINKLIELLLKIVEKIANLFK